MSKCKWLQNTLFISVRYQCSKTASRGMLLYILAQNVTVMIYISSFLNGFYIKSVWPLLSAYIVTTLFAVYATIMYPRSARIKLSYGIITTVLLQNIHFELLIYTGNDIYPWHLIITTIPIIIIVYVYFIERMVICVPLQFATILHHSIRLHYSNLKQCNIFISCMVQLSLLISTYIILKISCEQKCYQQNEHKNSDLLSNVIQNAPIGILIMQQSQIEYINDECRKLLSINTIDTVEIKSILQEYKLTAEELEQSPGHDKNYSFKVGERQLHWKIKVLFPTLEVHYFVDFTSEEAMKLDGKHKRYTEMLVATSTHELRTPLSAIKCSLSILKGQDSGQVFNENIERALCACELQECLINDIMDFSKIQGDKLRINFEKIDMKSIIMTCMKIVEIQIKDKNLSFNFRMSSGVSEDINSDSNRIRQVILNLLSNAIKFTLKGGITVKIKYKEHNVHVSIIDTGIGIKKEDIQKLFRPFGILDSSIKMNKTGTGLGLNLCKTICNKLGGDIYCKSVFEKGSKFVFYIPTVSSSPLSDSIKFMPSQSICLNNTFTPLLVSPSFQSSFLTDTDHILLVDDSILTITLTEKLIQKIGNPCIKAYNGMDALQKVKETKVKILLALIDINMPIMDGYSLADELHKLFEDRKLIKFPLYALTGDGGDDAESVYKDHHIDHVLTKPLNANKLKEIIHKSTRQAAELIL